LEHHVRKKEPVGFAVIGAMKLASGVLLLAAGFELFRLVNTDLGALLQRIVSRMHLDPENRLVHEVVSRLGGIDDHRLKEIAVGTFFYALLHFVEGTGLMLRQKWAGYLTATMTASLLPLELYELARKVTALRLFVLIVNLAILVYIVVKLFQEREADRAARFAEVQSDGH
jgi:uncharacterized membrane protein (DUF2068 family)